MHSNVLELGVLETNWFTGRHISVKPLFDIVSNLFSKSPHSYYYSMFNNRSSLQTAILFSYFAKSQRIYIASHGDESGALESSEGERISRTQLRNDLHDTNRQGRIKGIFLGACELGEISFVEFLLGKKGKMDGKSRLQWVAGYGTSVDWINSSAADLMFWNCFYSTRSTWSERDRITKTCEDLYKLAPGVFKDLKFNVFLKTLGPSGKIRVVIDNSDFDDGYLAMF